MEGEWGPTDKGSSVVAVHSLHLHITHLGSGSSMVEGDYASGEVYSTALDESKNTYNSQHLN